MEFTGERFIPTEQGIIQLEHYHRYAVAMECVAGKDVLDVACGEGYGSSLMASVARFVTGVDISGEAVEHASKAYQKTNLSFRQGSAANLDFQDASFDVVVSFETIEHLAEQSEMMTEIRRVLRPEGLLIISSPNRPVYDEMIGEENEFHVKELDFQEFDELLRSFFPAVKYCGQRVLTGSVIKPLDGAGQSFRAWHNNSNLQKGTGGAFKEPVYFMAFCASEKTILPELESSVLYPEKFDIFRHEKAQIEELRNTIESLVIDRDSQKKGFETLLTSYETVIGERDEAISQIQIITELRETVEALIIDRDAHKRDFETLRNSYEKVIGERDEIHAENREKDRVIGELRETVEALIIDRDAQKQGFETLHVSFEELTAEHDKIVPQLNATIMEREQQVKALSLQIENVFKSKSWRLTSPLRKFVKVVLKRDDAPISQVEIISQPGQTLNELAVAEIVSENESIEVTGIISEAPNSTPKSSILLVSYYCPTRAHAGGLRILDMYALIKAQRPDVQIDLLTNHKPSIDWSIDDAKQIFDYVYLSPSEDLTPFTLELLRGSKLNYDVIDLQFHPTAYRIDAFRKIGKKIIFTPMESLARSLFLEWLTKEGSQHRHNMFKIAPVFQMAYDEVGFTKKVDNVVCVSQSDAAFLRILTGAHNIKWVDTGISQFEFVESLNSDFKTTGAANRPCRVLYIAYFGSETNVVALRWYLENVHPIIKRKVPDYVLTVVGRGDLSPFTKYQDDSIEFVGEVSELAPHIQSARVGIAPALGGSGLRGKVNQYAILGIPSVVSPIASKGLLYRDGVNIFIAEEPDIFAERCRQLLTDFELNDRMGQAARDLCLGRYTWQSKWESIRRIYNLKEDS